MKNLYLIFALLCLAGGATAQVTTYSTPGAYTYTVPAGVTTVTVDVAGAKGADDGSGSGGYGGEVLARIAVTGGQVLYLYVGATGSSGSRGSSSGGDEDGGIGGFSGGGGGGAGSDVRTTAGVTSTRLVVGGGGGGGLSPAGGGAGAYPSGGNGAATSGGTASLGGTQSGPSGSNAFGTFTTFAGGGGGGYFGGVGGLNSSGGGGSSYYGGAGVTLISLGNGTRSGDGIITIAIAAPNTSPTFVSSSPQTATVCENSSATSINSLLTVSDADASQTETWSVATSPGHGTLGGFDATASSGSTSITPTGLTYTPTSGYNGADVFVIQVSDGSATATMSVNVTVTAAPAITVNPSNSTICSGNSTSFSVTATGAGLTYQWKISTDGGITYNNLTNTGIYTNVTTSTLNLTGATAAVNGDMYECVVSGTCTPSTTSTAATLTVNAAPNVTVNPSNSTICSGHNTSFSVTAIGTALTYQWEVSTDGGSTYNNLTNTGIYANVTTSTLNLTGATTAVSGNKYECVVSGTCAPGATTVPATLTVNPLPPVSGGAAVTICTGGSTTLTASGAVSYAWAPSTALTATTETSVSANPGLTTTYMLTGTDGNGCVNTASVMVSVNLFPNTARMGTGGSYSYVGSGTLVSLTSSTLLDGTYTVTYNIGGANMATASTASMVFSGGTGTFTTLPTVSTGNTSVLVVSLSTGDCTSPMPANGNSALYTVNPVVHH